MTRRAGSADLPLHGVAYRLFAKVSGAVHAAVSDLGQEQVLC